MKPKITILIIVAISLCFSQIAISQDNTFSFMHNVPQSIATNPAIQPNKGLFVGLPVVSSIGLGISNNGFAYNELITTQNEGVSQENINWIGLENILQEKNDIEISADVALLGLGYGYEDMYFSVNVTAKADFRMRYDKTFLEIYNGNYGENYSYSDFLPYVKATGYIEYAFGASKKINQKITIGARVKYLKGQRFGSISLLSIVFLAYSLYCITSPLPPNFLIVRIENK